MTTDADVSTPVVSTPLTVRVAVVGTALFTIAQIVASIAPRGATGLVAVVFSLVLFAAGSVAFVGAFVVAAGRSRDNRVTIAGVVWLTNAAPVTVARTLRIALVVQSGVALVTAGIRPFSAVAFGILAPMFGLGCIAWYGARHGTYAPIVAAADQNPAAETEDRGDVVDPTPPAAHESSVDLEDPDDFDQLFRRRKRGRR
ncbi:MAG TPA: hypothetical protein VFN21_08375 [Acidimicrobiales bacterium]|nr:hypothetical protein [Acidimicrobiales bacterium]